MSEELPTAVWSGSFTIFGVEVKCHTLSNGQRIIDADSAARLLAAMGDDSPAKDAGDLHEFARWRGGKP